MLTYYRVRSTFEAAQALPSIKIESLKNRFKLFCYLIVIVGLLGPILKKASLSILFSAFCHLSSVF